MRFIEHIIEPTKLLLAWQSPDERHRTRAAVDKDVRQLEAIGIVQCEYIVNPGHGRCRIVKAIDDYPIKLHLL